MARYPRIHDGPAIRVGAMNLLSSQSRRIIATIAPGGPFIRQPFAFAFPSPQCGQGNPQQIDRFTNPHKVYANTSLI